MDSKVFYATLAGKAMSDYPDIANQVFMATYNHSGITFKGALPIKVHFGERGNTTFVPPSYYQQVIASLKEIGTQPLYIETNVLYRGSRTTRSSHLEIAKAHGFTDLPIVIADGDRGEAYIEVPIHKTYFESCKIGQGFSDYGQMVVMSHFKGHGMAGFGGALKQLAMGFAARGGKMAQHAAMVPSVSASKCTACGLCVEKCDVQAIELAPKAILSSERCIGCAGCIAVCPVGAIRNDWSSEHFKEKMAEYAYAAQLNKEIVYLSYIVNVTAECDCMGSAMKPIAKDVAIVGGTDPIAVDQACLDLLASAHGHALFEEGIAALVHGEAIGLGARKYELIEV